jgi:hypothetical protein
MNYQPFLNMHILVSDDLLKSFRSFFEVILYVSLFLLAFLLLFITQRLSMQNYP